MDCKDFYYNVILEQTVTPGPLRDKLRKTELDTNGIERYTLSDMMALGPAPDAWIIPNLIPYPGRTIGFGDPGVCKTTTFFDMLVAIAAGETSWLGFPVLKNGKVLIWSSEGDIWKNRTRLLRHIRVRNDVDPNTVNLSYCQTPIQIDQKEGWHFFESVIAIERPLICIIDPWADFIDGNENDNLVVKQATKFLNHVIKTYEMSIVIIHHSGKDPRNGLRGASSLKGWADSVIQFKKMDKYPDAYQHGFPKSMLAGSKPIEIVSDKLREGKDNLSLISVPSFSDIDDGIITFSVLRYHHVGPVQTEENKDDLKNNQIEYEEAIIRHYMSSIFDTLALTSEPIGWTDITVKLRIQAKYAGLAREALGRLIDNKSAKTIVVQVKSKGDSTRGVEKYIIDRENCKVNCIIDTIEEVRRRTAGISGYAFGAEPYDPGSFGTLKRSDTGGYAYGVEPCNAGRPGPARSTK